jgi:hypothetical protein
VRRLLVSGLVVLAGAACHVEHRPYGGEKEQALAGAVVAGDPARVAGALKAGPDPNKLVRVGDDDQSPWYLALDRVRRNRPESIQIVKSLLAAGANGRTAWGTSGARDPALPKESFWQRFMGPSRRAGTGEESTIRLAMMHPVPDVIRALVAASFDPRDGESALVDAIESGEIEIAHILVDAGVDVNCRPGAITPLVAAIEARNFALMTYLEEHGARERP